MGINCPICGTRQNIILNITATGGPVKKPTDIIAQKLACGHTVGGEEYAEYTKRCTEIDTTASHRAREHLEAAQGKKAVLWKEIISKKEDL